jgi:hypothetical protein
MVSLVSLSPRDRVYLEDFVQFVVMNHVVVAEALRRAYAEPDISATAMRVQIDRLEADAAAGRAKSFNDGARIQTIVVARLMSEYAAAVEDLAAMMVAVSRRDEGVMRTYMASEPSDTGQILRDLEDGKEVREILALPDPAELPDDLDPAIRAGVDHALGAFAETLRQVAGAARMVPAVEATDLTGVPSDTLHLVLDVGSPSRRPPRGVLFQAHNRIKHRFMVVERLAELGLDPTEPIRFGFVGRDPAVVRRLVSNITQVALATAELAAVLLSYPAETSTPA